MIKALRLFILICCIAAACRLADTRVFAAQSGEKYEYARILTENTVFYADPDCSVAKFYLPYGYFVKVLSAGEDSVRIIYMDDSADVPAREGYIKTSCLHPFYDNPVNPYPKKTLTLGSDEVLFADSKLSQPKAVLSASVKAYFYGETTVSGEKYYYVYSNGYVGYVRKSAFLNPEIPAHPLPLPEQQTEQPETPQESQKQTTPHAAGLDSTVKTVVIIAVSLVALSVVYLLFKPVLKNNYAAASKDSDDDFNF